jgi:hypothetical protein
MVKPISSNLVVALFCIQKIHVNIQYVHKSGVGRRGGGGGGGLECEVVQLKPFYTTLNFWYRTDKIGTRTTFLWAGDIIFIA